MSQWRKQYPVAVVPLATLIAALLEGFRCYHKNYFLENLTANDRRTYNPHKFFVWIDGVQHINPVAHNFMRGMKTAQEVQAHEYGFDKFSIW